VAGGGDGGVGGAGGGDTGDAGEGHPAPIGALFWFEVPRRSARPASTRRRDRPRAFSSQTAAPAGPSAPTVPGIPFTSVAHISQHPSLGLRASVTEAASLALSSSSEETASQAWAPSAVAVAQSQCLSVTGTSTATNASVATVSAGTAATAATAGSTAGEPESSPLPGSDESSTALLAAGLGGGRHAASLPSVDSSSADSSAGSVSSSDGAATLAPVPFRVSHPLAQQRAAIRRRSLRAVSSHGTGTGAGAGAGAGVGNGEAILGGSCGWMRRTVGELLDTAGDGGEPKPRPAAAVLRALPQLRPGSARRLHPLQPQAVGAEGATAATPSAVATAASTTTAAVTDAAVPARSCDSPDVTARSQASTVDGSFADHTSDASSTLSQSRDTLGDRLLPMPLQSQRPASPTSHSSRTQQLDGTATPPSPLHASLLPPPPPPQLLAGPRHCSSYLAVTQQIMHRPGSQRRRRSAAAAASSMAELRKAFDASELGTGTGTGTASHTTSGTGTGAGSAAAMDLRGSRAGASPLLPPLIALPLLSCPSGGSQPLGPITCGDSGWLYLREAGLAASPAPSQALSESASASVSTSAMGPTQLPTPTAATATITAATSATPDTATASRGITSGAFDGDLAEAGPRTSPGHTTDAAIPRLLVAAVVDDSSVVRKLLSRVLQSEGFRVLEASDGREGLAVLKAHHCDVVFMDFLMPVCSGTECTSRYRAWERGEGATSEGTTSEGARSAGATSVGEAGVDRGPSEASYIVGMSANADEEDVARGMSAGMDEFRAKPLKLSELRRVVRQLRERLLSAAAAGQGDAEVA